MTTRKHPAGEMVECFWPDCKTMMEYKPNILYCDHHKKLVRKEQLRITSALSNAARTKRHQKARAEKAIPKPVLITDTAQAALNRSVDNKHSVDQRVKRYFHCEVKFAELSRYYGG